MNGNRSGRRLKACVLAGVLLIAGAISVTVMSTTSVVRRQRPRPVMPPGPPWKIVSPFGVLHIIKDRDALGTFIAAEELDTFNIKHLLGLQEGSTAQPMHVKFWQPLHLLLFLRRNGSNELVPVLGGPGSGYRNKEAGVDHFIAAVAACHLDMPSWVFFTKSPVLTTC